MKKCLLALLLSFCFNVFIHAQQAPKREMRGAWIATYANIDWPNRTQPPVLQRAALISILDHHQATGLNTVYIQIRSQCDAMYPSSIEPWSAVLTGTQGKAPTESTLLDPSATKEWDPLQFMIDECHRRGMEFHAWINPYRAVANYNQINSFAESHVAKQHPEWLLSQGTLRILNPGLPAVRTYINHVIGDVVSRYDLDGIHFDDYFYPPAAGAGVTPYNDDETFNADPRGFTDRGDWRRDNVNRCIKAVSDTIKALKPWVKFGVSPSGIYRNSTNPDIGSATSGLQHYVTLYADSRKWLQEGWIDYLAPQVYWYIGQPGANYAVIVPWWNNNAYGRHIYIGMAGYKVNDPLQGASWANPSQIPNEVRLNRNAAYGNIYGQSIYNTSSLRSSTRLGFRDSLRLNFYKKPALLPRMPWRDDTPPEPAAALAGVQYSGDSVVLSWTAPAEAINEMDKVKRFVIYRSENPVIDITNSANIVAITPEVVTSFIDKQLPGDTTYYYTITSLDRFHNESQPSNVTDYQPPVITCAGTQELDTDNACSITLPDYAALASVRDDVSPASSINIVQSPAPGTVMSGPGGDVVTLTATDASGKSSSCSFMLIRIDRLAPVITSTPEDILVHTAAEAADCSSNVNWTEPTAVDNCTIPLAYFSRTHIPGAAFPVGTTRVTYIFKDEAGNETTTSFNIVVEDDTKPVIVTKDIARSLVNGTVTITAEDINNGSWDNCGIDVSSLTVSPATFTCANIGENTVTLTGLDQYGNENTATAIVTVTGTIPQPSIKISRGNNTYTGLPDNTIALGYGAQQLTLSLTNNSLSSQTYYEWTPAAGLSNTNSSSTVFTPTEEGTYTFTVQVTNEYGCAGTAEVTVDVIDARCGFRNNKVKVCLTAFSHSFEVCVSSHAAGVLLMARAPRATLGSCHATENFYSEDFAQTTVLAAYPNPFDYNINLQFDLPVSDRHVRLDIYDVYGEKVMNVFEGSTEAGQAHKFSVSTNQLRGDIFLARLVTSSGQTYYIKLIRGNR